MMQVLNRQQMLMYLLQRRMIGQLMLHKWHSYPLFFQVLAKQGHHHQRRVRNAHKRMLEAPWLTDRAKGID